jgi:hypothetical protein
LKTRAFPITEAFGAMNTPEAMVGRWIATDDID